jgi:hypothetical protein
MKNKFRNYTILLHLLTSISLISCGSGGDTNVNFDSGNFNFPPPRNTAFEAEEAFSEEVEVENRSQMRLKGVNDKITITGISGANSVIITGMKRVKSDSTQDAEAHLQELEVNVQSLANEVFVETILPQDTGGRIYEVDYTITLPKDLEIQITNVNRNVTLNAIDNNITVNNENGDVTLMEIFGSAVVNLTNGIIESEVTLPLNGTIDLNTVNGNINLDIPANTSAGFLATVNIGSISDSNLMFQNEVRTPTSLSGTLGNGQGTISLESEATGSISVSGF